MEHYMSDLMLTLVKCQGHSTQWVIKALEIFCMLALTQKWIFDVFLLLFSAFCTHNKICLILERSINIVDDLFEENKLWGVPVMDVFMSKLTTSWHMKHAGPSSFCQSTVHMYTINTHPCLGICLRRGSRELKHVHLMIYHLQNTHL